MKAMELPYFFHSQHPHLPTKSVMEHELTPFAERLQELHDQIEDAVEQVGGEEEVKRDIEVWLDQLLKDHSFPLPEEDLDIRKDVMVPQQGAELAPPLMEWNNHLASVYTMPHQAVDMMLDVQKIIGQILQQEEMPSKPVIGHLFKLFDQWSNMQHDMGKAVLEDVVDQVLTPEEKRLFENVLARFQKRQFFSGKGMYQQQAQMTKTELGKWLQETIQQLKDIEQPKIKGRFQPSLQQTTFVDNVMAKQIKETTRDIESGLPLSTNMRDGTNAQPMPPHYVDHALRQTNQSAPMTKTEQYVMHMQHLGKIEQISQELKGQLTMIIRDSSFLKPDLLENVQLSIMLKPAHLGNMHIKFAQIDGEMMVHMLVSSQAAKDMLESNLHQLKSVFSPHQIVIEREEQVLEDEYLSEEESPDEQANEEHFQDGTQDESNQSANKETQEIDFETLFQAVRKEETVDEF